MKGKSNKDKDISHIDHDLHTNIDQLFDTWVKSLPNHEKQEVLSEIKYVKAEYNKQLNNLKNVTHNELHDLYDVKIDQRINYLTIQSDILRSMISKQQRRDQVNEELKELYDIYQEHLKIWKDVKYRDDAGKIFQEYQATYPDVFTGLLPDVIIEQRQEYKLEQSSYDEYFNNPDFIQLTGVCYGIAAFKSMVSLDSYEDDIRRNCEFTQLPYNGSKKDAFIISLPFDSSQQEQFVVLKERLTANGRQRNFSGDALRITNKNLGVAAIFHALVQQNMNIQGNFNFSRVEGGFSHDVIQGLYSKKHIGIVSVREKDENKMVGAIEFEEKKKEMIRGLLSFRPGKDICTLYVSVSGDNNQVLYTEDFEFSYADIEPEGSYNTYHAVALKEVIKKGDSIELRIADPNMAYNKTQVIPLSKVYQMTLGTDNSLGFDSDDIVFSDINGSINNRYVTHNSETLLQDIETANYRRSYPIPNQSKRALRTLREKRGEVIVSSNILGFKDEITNGHTDHIKTTEVVVHDSWGHNDGKLRIEQTNFDFSNDFEYKATLKIGTYTIDLHKTLLIRLLNGESVGEPNTDYYFGDIYDFGSIRTDATGKLKKEDRKKLFIGLQYNFAPRLINFIHMIRTEFIEPQRGDPQESRPFSLGETPGNDGDNSIVFDDNPQGLLRKLNEWSGNDTIDILLLEFRTITSMLQTDPGSTMFDNDGGKRLVDILNDLYEESKQNNQ